MFLAYPVEFSQAAARLEACAVLAQGLLSFILAHFRIFSK